MFKSILSPTKWVTALLASPTSMETNWLSFSPSVRTDGSPHVRQWLSCSNQRLYLQQCVQLQSILSVPIPTDPGLDLSGSWGANPLHKLQLKLGLEIAATGSDAAAIKMVLCASQHFKFVKALHARMLVIMMLKNTQTLTPEAFHSVVQYLRVLCN